ncbi:MAG: hypothetical protein NXI22_24310 [bacterium]|nr:hypothetical protein [bacterium]
MNTRKLMASIAIVAAIVSTSLFSTHAAATAEHCDANEWQRKLDGTGADDSTEISAPAKDGQCTADESESYTAASDGVSRSNIVLTTFCFNASCNVNCSDGQIRVVACSGVVEVRSVRIIRNKVERLLLAKVREQEPGGTAVADSFEIKWTKKPIRVSERLVDDPVMRNADANQIRTYHVYYGNVKATVEYDDGSTKEVYIREGISRSRSDVRLASDDPRAFLVQLVKREAIFPCEITSGPSGRVIVGPDPS